MIHGIGIDIVSKNNIREAVGWRGKAFLKFVFTPREIEYAFKYKDFISHLSAMFSAKEAVIKSIGTGWRGGVRMTDIEIQHTSTGKPEVRLSGNLRKIAELVEIERVFVSLSYEDEYAIALAASISGS